MAVLSRDINWDRLTSEQIQFVIDLPIEKRRDLFTYFLQGSPQQLPWNVGFLKLILNNVQLSADATTNDPQEYFKTRTGLWVSDDFKNRILTKVQPVENLHPTTLKLFELKKNAYDREITPELGENYLFDESELCARIEQMIEKQPNGEEGDLLNDGHVNLFYVVGYVVGVRRNFDNRGWDVGSWDPDVGSWSAGYRVFSRN
jgi:hypothetical protein